MRRIYLKVWQGIPCSGRKCLRTESQRDIAEILQSKLATIIEEPDMDAALLLTPTYTTINLLKNEDDQGSDGNKQRVINKIKMGGKCLKSELNFRGLYELLVAGFSTKLGCSSGSSSSSISFAVIRK